MPFLEGIPCSIHGFNTGDGTAAFLPVEMIIFRHAERPEFIYGRAANFWNPPDEVRDEMRRAARNMGALLDERVGYRGGFDIDGVATAEGFRPTELNPRLAVGHFIQAQAADLSPGSLERLIIAGDLDIAAADLEEDGRSGSRAHSRWGHAPYRPRRPRPGGDRGGVHRGRGDGGRRRRAQRRDDEHRRRALTGRS